MYLALCVAVSSAYQRNPETGRLGWSINMTIHETLESLGDYCKPSNAQVEKHDATLMPPYDANTPIATVFELFDQCRAVVRANKTPYTEEQLVQKFITLLKKNKSV